jgi:hypothetical protein
LGSNVLVVRLGGIYALEGVMNSSDQYHQAVLEALTAFVRENAKGNTTWVVPTDIQAALTVIGRRSAYVGDIINLVDANLTEAELTGANLTFADLRSANLTAVDLTGANLIHASLARAKLKGAYLGDANLTNADLTSADLTNANLTSAEGLDQKQLDDACGSDAKLPTGLTLKPCPQKGP